MTMTGDSEFRDKLLIGASGYSYDDWVGSFYPKGLAKSDFLRFYASRFPVVEINATYYRIPPPRSFAAMAAKAPPGFRFVVKGHQDMTHHQSREQSLFTTFRDSIQPLCDAGMFDGVLLQFPFSFRNQAAGRAHLALLRDRLPGMRLWAEFRHAGWAEPAVLAFLRERDIGYCSVDEPRLPGLMPPLTAATTDTGYIRFHGRNAATWWGGGHERYDWDYTAQELSEWLDRIRNLARETDRTYIFFNNCYMGRAVKSAGVLRRLLGLDTDLDLFAP